MVNWYPVNQDQIDKGRVFNQEKEREGGREGERETEKERERERAVSYTHLTLPTTAEV